MVTSHPRALSERAERTSGGTELSGPELAERTSGGTRARPTRCLQPATPQRWRGGRGERCRQTRSGEPSEAGGLVRLTGCGPRVRGPAGEVGTRVGTSGGFGVSHGGMQT